MSHPSKPEAAPSEEATEPAPSRRRKGLRLMAELGVVLLVFLGIRAWQQRDVVHGDAPPLAGASVEGTPLSLTHDGERPTLVHFWATWCSVCRAEQGTIDGLAEEYRVVTVATQSGDREAVAGYLAENGLDFPVVLDPRGQLAHEWGVSAFPTSFVLSPDGTIEHVEVGFTTSAGLRTRLWLAGR